MYMKVSWRRTTKNISTDILQETLIDAATKRINISQDNTTTYVDDFLDFTADAYKKMRLVERNYLWTLEQERISSLNAIDLLVPGYSVERIDASGVIKEDGLSRELKLACQTNTLLETMTLQMGALLNRLAVVEVDNKTLLGKVTGLEADNKTLLGKVTKLVRRFVMLDIH